MSGGNKTPGRSVLSKASAILGLFETQRRPLPLSEIASQIDLPVSSVHRLLTEMCELGLLNRTQDNRYQPGIRVWKLGESVGYQLRATAFPFVQDLYTQTGQTTHLAIRDGNQVLYLMRLYGTKRIPKTSATGGHLPIHTTAVGKAILAHEPPEVISAILEATDLHSGHTGPNAILDSSRIIPELEQVRRHGYAMTFEEQRVGTASIAAPIFHGDQVGGGLGIVVSADQRSSLHKMLPLLREASLKIEKATVITPLESLISDRNKPTPQS